MVCGPLVVDAVVVVVGLVEVDEQLSEVVVLDDVEGVELAMELEAVALIDVVLEVTGEMVEVEVDPVALVGLAVVLDEPAVEDEAAVLWVAVDTLDEVDEPTFVADVEEEATAAADDDGRVEDSNVELELEPPGVSAK